jgi:cyanate lyase
MVSAYEGAWISASWDLAAFVERTPRKRANLSQQEVADRIGRGQTFISAVERGQHRVSVLEFLDFAEAIGFDAAAALRRVVKAATRWGDRGNSTPTPPGCVPKRPPENSF